MRYRGFAQMPDDKKHYSPTSREQREFVESTAAERYRYFIEQVSQWDEAWALRDDEGFMAFAGEDDVTCFPLWPAEAYARRAALAQTQKGAYAKMRPVPVPLDELVEKMLPAWENQGVAISVFWVPPGKSVVVSAAELRAALSDDGDEAPEPQ